jgi:hypothetical protein
MSTDFDFKLYAAVWFTKIGWDLPDVQLEVFDYLDNDDWGRNQSKALLLWRGLGKSMTVDMWVAYKLTKNPALRFLILSADKETARKSSQDILSIIRQHPFSSHLAPDLKRTGGGMSTRSDLFSVKGATDKRNPSVRAMGVLSNITGGRADYIVYDDVEVPKNSGSEQKRYDLRRKMSESTHLLTPDYGFKLLIGTYHDSESIYDEAISNGASFMRVPLLSDIKGEFPYMTGTSRWPERFTDEIIADKQKACSGKAEFLSQYLLIPSSIKDSILDSTLFRIYTGEIEFGTANGRGTAKLQMVGKEPIYLRSVSCWWDPSLSTARGDDSVVAMVFTDDDGNYYIHNTTAVFGDTDQQCEQVKRIALKYHIPVVCVETNGIGALLPPILIKHLAQTGIGVDGIHSPSSQTKNHRIISAFETPLYGGRLFLHQSVADGSFINQIRDFDPSTTRNRDDYIDSVANCILREPVRIGSIDLFGRGTINNGWMAQGSHSIEMDSFSF